VCYSVCSKPWRVGSVLLETLEVFGSVGGVGGDAPYSVRWRLWKVWVLFCWRRWRCRRYALCATLYAGGCGEWPQFRSFEILIVAVFSSIQSAADGRKFFCLRQVSGSACTTNCSHFVEHTSCFQIVLTRTTWIILFDGLPTFIKVYKSGIVFLLARSYGTINSC